MNFPSSMTGNLGYYVYLYMDPLDDTIFYVGKGKGNRAFDHLNDQSESNKVHRIQEIRHSGHEPRIEILIHGIKDEETALRVEAAVIDLLGIDNLTNEKRGWESGLYGRMEVGEIRAMYERERAVITEPAILFRINPYFRYGMQPVELYDATRGIWRVGEAREKAKYAFAVYDGIVREVYEIKHWFPAGTTFSTRPPEELQSDERWEFVGAIANDSLRKKYLLKSVDYYFPKGARNPIMYVNIE